MKTHSHISILFVLVLGFSMAPIDLYAESEPNNDRQSATPIPANGEIAGTLSKGDEDWYVGICLMMVLVCLLFRLR
jgi:hypothetical protein